jgi:hypothetical protein
MSKDLQKLKTLGAQKIHEDTHIALRYVQSVIHESFEGLTKVQFLGFISILEREYNLDLSSLKRKSLEYFEDEDTSDDTVFMVTEKKTNFAGLYIVIVLLIFLFAIYESFDFTKTNVSTKTIDNNAIVDAQKKISVKKKVAVIEKNIRDENLTVIVPKVNTVEELNTSVVIPITAPKVKKIEVKKKIFSLVIKPRTKVWIGYINKTDHKKRQAIVKNILTLDATKEWLIAAGHGNINIVLNGKTTKYSAAHSVRYLYKNGTLKKLSIKEFKKLNNGRLW